MSEGLKSCPLCGKEAELSGPYTYDMTILHGLGCSDPRCVFFRFYINHPFEDDMRAAWNSPPRREEIHGELTALLSLRANPHGLCRLLDEIASLAAKYAPQPEEESRNG